ncbi:hypothetical protein SDC9_99223 [bioreactor metagenome]|uniref:Uncharacterized protein n=1 Tax=bioreactor metagenome TaxID=1076179 RepID=A0A645AS96_9ZZZZ
MLRFLLRELLTQDVLQQRLLSRTAIIGIDCFIFDCTLNRKIIRKIALQHLHFEVVVRFRIQQDSRALLPVPPCSPYLLHIFLQRVRHVVMDHIADVRFIDPHSEGTCGANDVQLILKELMLNGDPVFICPVGMIGFRAQICFFSDHESYRISLCFTGEVNDARRWISLQKLQEVLVFPFWRHCRDFIVNIRTVDRTFKYIQVVSIDMQGADDVAHHSRRRGRSERQRQWIAQCFPSRSQKKIIGTEIQAPLGNAVRFINHKQSERDLLELVQHNLVLQHFWRKEQKLDSIQVAQQSLSFFELQHAVQ